MLRYCKRRLVKRIHSILVKRTTRIDYFCLYKFQGIYFLPYCLHAQLHDQKYTLRAVVELPLLNVSQSSLHTM